MELPSISLHFLVQETLPLIQNSRISKIHSIGKNAFRFKLSTLEGTKDLILVPSAFFLSDYRIPSSTEQSGFVQVLRKHIEGKRIGKFSQKNWDRIVEFEFEEVRLVLELFADGNVVLVGKDGKIISCLHREEWKDRTIQRGYPYQYPASKPVPSEVTFQEFSKSVLSSPKKIVSALMENYNLFPALAEESALKSGISKEKAASTLSKTDLQSIHKNLKAFFSEAAKEKPVIIQSSKEKILLPFSLPKWTKEHQFEALEAESLNSALDSFFVPQLAAAPEPESQTSSDQKLKKMLFSLAQQKNAVEKFESQAEEAKQQAEWIFSHYAELLEIKKALETAEQKAVPEKEVLQTLQNSNVSGFEIARKIAEVKPKKKRAVFEI